MSDYSCHVNSGFRYKKHNTENEIGGSLTSQHLLGRAADIDTTRLSAEKKHKLAEAAFASGIRGFVV